jgi:peptide/nickel transport system substrate-binding protein
VGSGPFRFLPNEWVSGARAAYARFDGYRPRQEKPDFLAGGKMVNFERVEWIVQPDPSTAATALQKNEVDWVAQPLIDLCPVLRKSPGVTVEVLSPYGWLAMIRINHLQPPFDNPALRRALLPGIDQGAFVEAVIGDQAEFGHVPAGFFSPGQPLATEAGLAVMAGGSGVPLAKKLVAESGYGGQAVVLLAPTDQPAVMALAQVTRDYFMSIGLNVDLQAMDFGTLGTRSFNQGPPDKGGWNAFNVVYGGLPAANPGGSYPLRSNGRKGWAGWPTDERLEALRGEWFDAATLAEQKRIAEQSQQRALETVPFVPLGQIFQPQAFRSDLAGIVKGAYSLFWGVQRT